ncbi:MAG TPA: TonB-dependent receptor plug domain-containing protein, partial [Chitinophagales bacterium]|nr:TonB-dependent receptor plug domain-containing protein [Chitinophagales bacterium]
MRNKFILLFIALGASWCAANAQHADSLFASKPVNLSDVVVNGRSDNEGPSLNYYMRDKLSTTEEILERTAGVTLIRRGNYGMEPVLRSYSGGQINLTINGMKIFGACTDKMDPPTIYTEPENLNAISLTQGASGSRYGSTVGGSLDMEMKEAQCTPLRDFYFTTASSYSSVNNSYNGSFAVSSSGPKASFRLSGVYRKAFDYKTAGGVSVPHSGYEKANYLASAMFNIRPQQWLTLDYMGDLGWNIGYPALPMDVDRARANIGSVAYLVNPLQGTLKRVETKVYFNHIYHQMGNAERPEAPMPMDMPGWSYTAGAYSDMEFAAGKNNRLELRTDYYANFTKASMTMHWPGAADMYMLTLPDNLRQFAGAFVEDEWAIKPNHLLKFN